MNAVVYVDDVLARSLPPRASVMLTSYAPLRFPFSACCETVEPLRRAEEAVMDRMISVVDLSTGEITERTSTTLTLDLPPDFERASSVVTLDQLSHGHYLATTGKEREYSVFPRPLSWRARGEDCLIAERRARKPSSIAGTYRLTAVDWE